MRVPNDHESLKQFEKRFERPEKELNTIKLDFNPSALRKLSSDLSRFVLSSMIRVNEVFYSKMRITCIQDYQFNEIEAKKFLYLTSKTLRLSEFKISFTYGGECKFPRNFVVNFLTFYKDNRYLKKLKPNHLYRKKLTLKEISLYEYKKIFYALSLLVANEKLIHLGFSSDLTAKNPMSVNVLSAIEKRNRLNQEKLELISFSVGRNEFYSYYKNYVSGS